MPRFPVSLGVAALIGLGGLGGCSGGVRVPPDVIGQPLDAAAERFGAAASDTVLVLGRGASLYEYQGGLHQTLLDTLRAGTTVRVREQNWDDPNRAVWAVERNGRWVVVDALEWDGDVEF